MQSNFLLAHGAILYFPVLSMKLQVDLNSWLLTRHELHNCSLFVICEKMTVISSKYRPLRFKNICWIERKEVRPSAQNSSCQMKPCLMVTCTWVWAGLMGEGRGVSPPIGGPWEGSVLNRGKGFSSGSDPGQGQEREKPAASPTWIMN